MNDGNPNCELLLRYLDGTLSPDDQIDVENLLLHDAAARLTLRDIAEQAVVAADVQRVRHGNLGETTAKAPADNSARLLAWNRLLLAVAVVALVAVVLSQVLLRRDHARQIITITACNGPLEWTGNGGRVTEELTAGSRLSGGTLELLAPDAWVAFEFQDQSTVTLMGQAAVTISQQRQKLLRLRHGRLSASIQPQPAGHPMLVHTPSAELRVLGTQFNVESSPETTQLTVNEGRVRLKRLIDGKEVDVPARTSVTAAMEDRNGLSLRERGKPITVWKSNLQADVVSGKWVSDLWMLGLKLKKAVASGEMAQADAMAAYKTAAMFDDEAGSVWTVPSPYGSLVVLSVPRSAELPVLLTADARIRVRGRVYSQVSLTVGMTTHGPDGGFAGKYSAKVAVEDRYAGGNDFEMELPVSRFRDDKKSHGSPIGNELVDWWCVAEKSSVKVQITSVELIDNSEQDAP